MEVRVEAGGAVCCEQGADLRVCDLERWHRHQLHLVQRVRHLQYPLINNKKRRR